MDEFQEIGFCILAGSIFFCETYPFIVVKTIKSNNLIHSQSLLKNLGGGGGGGGGQDKPAGIGCPPPIIEGIFSD